MTINDFHDLVDFPEPLQGVVYILFYVASAGRDVPFYVGQTGRYLPSRLAEYLYADFQASTDFKVGEGVRYLIRIKGVRVRVAQAQSTDRFADEAKMIVSLRPEHVLLNDLASYDYKTAEREKELARVHKFCDDLLATSEC